MDCTYKLMDSFDDVFSKNFVETELCDFLMKTMVWPQTDPKNLDASKI